MQLPDLFTHNRGIQLLHIISILVFLKLITFIESPSLFVLETTFG